MTRRDFYRFATMAVGSLMGLVLAVPGVAYVVSPLRKKESEGSFETLTRLSQLEAGVPRSFAIIKERHDAWVKYPREPVGSVWLIRQPAGRPSRSSPSRPSARTWAVPSISPAEQEGFLCPCHTSSFDFDGKAHQPGPTAPMDRLEVELTEGDDPEIRVKFERFRTQSEEKIPLV